MSNTEVTTNQKGVIDPVIEDPPEVTDIVIVSNPPPSNDEEVTFKVPKRTGFFALKISKTTITPPYDTLFFVINNVVPVESTGAPDPVSSGNFVANFNGAIEDGEFTFFQTPFTLFKGKLKDGEVYCLKYEVYRLTPDKGLVRINEGTDDSVKVIQG